MIRVAKTSDRSCYSNKMTPLPTAIIFFGTVNCSYKIVHASFFSPIHSPREVKAESVRASVIAILWDEDFIVRKLIR